MSCLPATFTLTPKSPWFQNSLASLYGELNCYGADFFAYPPVDFVSLYADDSFFFTYSTAADPGVDYTQWDRRKKVPFIELYLWGTPAAHKELALIFGFLTYGQGRVLIYDNAGLISDQTLQYGDNQFLLEIESLDAPVHLYFIHAGESWFFKGISGYLV